MNKVFSASLDTLYEMLNFIKEQAEIFGFDPVCISQIELAAEEAIVNIVSYGYPSDQKGTIEISCFPAQDGSIGLKIMIKDDGIPYNPLTTKKTESISLIEKRVPGGFGVFFILKIMDEVEYKREDNANILILVKYR